MVNEYYDWEELPEGWRSRIERMDCVKVFSLFGNAEDVAFDEVRRRAEEEGCENVLYDYFVGLWGIRNTSMYCEVGAFLF